MASVGMAPGFGGEFRRSWLGHNGARYAHIARNHLRLGFAHGGAPLLLTEGEAFSPQAVYLHHPPGLGWALAGVFAVTGVHEDAARGLSALASLAALLLLARLVADITDARTGALAALLTAALPMTWVFGTHVEVQGPLVLAASLAVLLLGRRALAGEAPLWPALAAALVAGWIDWYGLYAPVLVGLVGVGAGGRARRRGLLLVGAGLALFGALLAWLATRPGAGGLDEILGAAGHRGPAGLDNPTVDRGAQLAAWARQIHALLPGVPLLLGGLAVWWARRPSCPRRRLWLLLVAPPLLHGAAFPAGMIVHSYWLFGLAPALGAGLALALVGRPRLALGAAGALVLAGVLLRPQALPPENRIPARVGQALARETPPGELVLTNYDTNLPLEGATDDRFVMLRPEVTFYADRPVRGGLATPAELAAARARLPAARWFLLTPWPAGASPELRAALAAAAAEPPRRLSDAPVVELYRLAR